MSLRPVRTICAGTVMKRWTKDRKSILSTPCLSVRCSCPIARVLLGRAEPCSPRNGAYLPAATMAHAAGKSLPVRALALAAVLVALLVPCAPFSSRAQAEPPAHALAVGLGLSLTQLREDLVAPIRFVGPSAALGAEYAYAARSFDVLGRFRWSFGVAFDRYDTTSFIVLPSLFGAMRGHVADTGWRPLRVGGALALREVLAYLEPWNDSHFYFIGVTSLGPSAALSPRITDARELALELTIPVIAFVSRPPRYPTRDASNLVSLWHWHDRWADEPRLTSVHEFVSLTLRAEYRRRDGAFHIAPWAELELDTVSFPERATRLSLWLGAQTRFGL